MNPNIEPIKAMLMDLNNQRISINKLYTCGIISEIDVTNELQVINKREIKLKEKLIGEVHIRDDGEPRSIRYQESKDLWITVTANGTKICGRTRETVLDKLFDYYGLTLNDLTIKGVFNAAISQKALTDNNDENTIEHLQYDFARYISSDLAQKDIRKIKGSDLKSYTQNLVRLGINGKLLTKKSYWAYKGVLNVIFDYACSKEVSILSYNPVSEIENARYFKNIDTTKARPEDKILSEEDIQSVREEIRRRMKFEKYHGYFVFGYMMLTAIETGMRSAELCSLKWQDVNFKENYIYIHSQQLSHKKQGGKEYYYAPWTKNEREKSVMGRKFPLTIAIRSILLELKQLQNGKNIVSEYVFAKENGEWSKTDAYETCLRRLMESMGFNVRNNHAFRMSLNSNVFIPLGIEAPKRAELLGHSVQTNLNHYTYARIDTENDVLDRLNTLVSNRSPVKSENLIHFSQKESPEKRVKTLF